MARKSREQLGISSEEYKLYQEVRKARNKINKKISENYAKSLNPYYKDLLYSKTVKERNNKRFTIGDFRSKYQFDEFLEGGKRYTNYEEYIAKKSREYTFNFEQALSNMGANESQLERFRELVKGKERMLDEVYSSSSELDLSYVYTETLQEGIERIDMTLDVLEDLINEVDEE